MVTKNIADKSTNNTLPMTVGKYNNDISKAVQLGQKMSITFEPEDVQMFKAKFPELYLPLENIALRRIVASNIIDKEKE